MKDKILQIIKEQSEKSNVRQFTCVNGFGFSQFERDLAEEVIKEIQNELTKDENKMMHSSNDDGSFMYYAPNGHYVSVNQINRTLNQ